MTSPTDSGRDNPFCAEHRALCDRIAHIDRNVEALLMAVTGPANGSRRGLHEGLRDLEAAVALLVAHEKAVQRGTWDFLLRLLPATLAALAGAALGLVAAS